MRIVLSVRDVVGIFLAADLGLFLLCMFVGALKGFTLAKTLEIMRDATGKADWPWHPWRERS